MPAVSQAQLIVDIAGLEELAPQWDELARANKRPMQSPAWLLAWLRHLAPARAEPRVVAVWLGAELVGVAPFYVDLSASGRIDYRLMGDSFPRSSPLASPGLEGEVAGAIAGLLAGAKPRPDVIALESEPLGSTWGESLKRHWSGAIRPIRRRYLLQDSPTINLADKDFDDWLSHKSSNFRSQMRRVRRQFTEAGGSARISSSSTLDGDIDAFMRLHSERWQGRGASSIAARAEQMRATFNDVARTQSESGRFRLWMLEIEGEPISAQLFIEAGGELLYMNGGWDERYASLKPAMLGILYAIEDAFARGEERIDLAPGRQQYKLRFADGNDPVAWTILIVPGWRLPLTVARVTPMLTREAARRIAKQSLSQKNVDRVRRIRGLGRREHA